MKDKSKTTLLEILPPVPHKYDFNFTDKRDNLINNTFDIIFRKMKNYGHSTLIYCDFVRHTLEIIRQRKERNGTKNKQFMTKKNAIRNAFERERALGTKNMPRYS